MDYQARLNDILTMLDQGEYLGDGGVESAQEDVTALFLESVGKNEEACNYKASHWKSKLGAKQDGIKVGRNEMRRDIRRKWQTNQESGE